MIVNVEFTGTWLSSLLDPSDSIQLFKLAPREEDDAIERHLAAAADAPERFAVAAVRGYETAGREAAAQNRRAYRKGTY